MVGENGLETLDFGEAAFRNDQPPASSPVSRLEEEEGQAARQETRPSSSRARKFCPERFVSLVTWRHAGHVTVSSLQRIDPLCGSITQPISKHLRSLSPVWERIRD